MKGFTKLCYLMLAGIGCLAAQDLTITNARIIGPNASVIERGSIVVRGGKDRFGGGGRGHCHGGNIIDAQGMTAMPGFIDGHRHINTGPNEKAQMQALLEAGYTTVLSGGGPAEGNITLRDHIEKGVINGPRIIPSGSFLRLNQQHAGHGARGGPENGRAGDQIHGRNRADAECRDRAKKKLKCSGPWSTRRRRWALSCRSMP